MVFLTAVYGTCGNGSFPKKENTFKMYQNVSETNGFPASSSSFSVPETGLGPSVEHRSRVWIHICKIQISTYLLAAHMPFMISEETPPGSDLSDMF